MSYRLNRTIRRSLVCSLLTVASAIPLAVARAQESEEAPSQPAAEAPADEKPADEKPADEKPADEKPADEKPAEEKPAEEKPAEEKPADLADSTFDSLHRQWSDTESRLQSLVQAYRNATDVAERRTIVAEYRALIEQSGEILTQLEQAALAEYRQAPNENAEVPQMLLKLANNHIKQDRYEQAMEITELLQTNNYENPALDALMGKAAYCLNQFELAEKHLKQAQEAKVLGPEDASILEDLETQKEKWQRETELRAAEAEADDLPRVELETTDGKIVIELFENEAPQTVGNFVSLVESGFYDGLTFHRVLPGFMAQGGCPEGTGKGDPGYKIYCECVRPDHRDHFRGSLSMAKGPAENTGGSQFFVTFRPTPFLDGRHTVFGRVIEGLDVLAKIQRRNPQQPGQPEPDKILSAKVLRKRDHEYQPTKVGEGTPPPREEE